MIVTIILLALLFTLPAHAADLWLSPGALSHHTDRNPAHCEKNPGVLVEARQGDHGLLAGQYKNSYCKTSTLLAYRYTAARIGPCFGALIVGAVDGYPGNHGRVTPAGAPELGCGNKYVEVGVMAMPPVVKSIDGWAFVASVRVRFW